MFRLRVSGFGSSVLGLGHRVYGFGALCFGLGAQGFEPCVRGGLCNFQLPPVKHNQLGLLHPRRPRGSQSGQAIAYLTLPRTQTSLF